MVFKRKIYDKFLEWKNTSLGKSALLYEIDFILSRKNKVYPIEVKSSSYKTHSSLDAFCKKYSSRIHEKYLVYTKEFRKDSDIFCIPFYFVPFL